MTLTKTASRVLFAACPAVAMAATLLASPARAQSIDCQVASRPQLTPADETLVREAVTAISPGLSSAEPAVSEKARNDLLRPLRCSDVSRSFRLNLGTAMSAELGRLAASESEHVAINAMRIAGEIATTATTEVLTRGLRDERPGVRCMAAIGFRDTLRLVAQGSAGIVGANVDPMLDELARRIESDADVHVVENLILALDATRADATLHQQAMRRLAPSLAKRAAALRTDVSADHARWQVVMVRGIDGVTVPMTAAAGQVNEAYRVQAALLAGQTIAYVRHRMEGEEGLGNPLEADGLRTLVNTSERVLLLAEASRGGSAPQRQTLLPRFEDAVRTGEAQGFVAEADRWLGGSGILVRAPYNAKAADFR